MLSVGTVVRSNCGHDVGGFFVVMCLEGDFAFICDGKLRPLLNLKKKRLKHLSKTNTVLRLDCLKTDKQIRNALHRFNHGDKQNMKYIF